jgi:hypothetical protein
MTVINDSNLGLDDALSFSIMILQLIIVICGFIKILYFIRIYESYGFLVQMVGETCVEIVPFMVFFTLWILFFSVCY